MVFKAFQRIQARIAPRPKGSNKAAHLGRKRLSNRLSLSIEPMASS